MTKRRIIIAIIAVLFLAGGSVAWWFVWGPGSSVIKTVGQASSPSSVPKPVPTSLDCIKKLPDDTRFAQKIMVAGYADQLSAELPALVKYKVGGVILMDEATQEQITALKTAIAITPFVGVDQEGGSVQRYTTEGILPGATAMAAGYSPDQAYRQYLSDDRYLHNLGITTNFAPVLEVESREPNPLPGRDFSSDPGEVGQYAKAAITAAQAAGITPVVKHFPGLGSATGNTDYAPATTDSLDVLQTRDILPYRSVAPLSPDAMVANVIVPGLTDGQPAVWSSKAVKLLRGLGYQQAVIYSDSLTAQAIDASVPEAVVKAWSAGVDVALVVQNKEQTPLLGSLLADIIAAGKSAQSRGSLKLDDTAASVNRIFTRKGVQACSL